MASRSEVDVFRIMAAVREAGALQAMADHDVAGLRELGLVRFEGAAKTGSHVLAGEAAGRK